jgi:chaperonin GroES
MLRPVDDKVIVKLAKEKEAMSPSGLIIPGLNDEKPNQATVVAVGPGLMLDNGVLMKPDVQVGDLVVFSKYQGTEITHDGESLLILAYRDIVAVIGDAENE